MNRLTYEQLIEIDGILHEPLFSQQEQLRELEDLFNSILASQRQAILKEVREGFYHKIRCTTVSGSNVIKNGQYFEQKDIDAHLDALEKKYKGGEETLEEKI